jgi:hypothetical protein
MTDRPPGILTQKQREFIRASEDERSELMNNRQEHYKYRKRIQRRIENALADFRLLSEFDREFSTDDVDEAFSGDEDGEEIDAGAYVTDAFRFLARALDDDDAPLYPNSDVQPAYDEQVECLERALERDAAERKDSVVEVDLSLSVSGALPPEAVLRELEHGDASPAERMRFVTLLQEMDIDSDRLAEAAPELVGDSGDSGDDADE